MARRKLENKLIDKLSITEVLKLVPGSETDYIDCHGNVYKDYGNGKFFPKKAVLNKDNGYLYVGITLKNGKNKTYRLHVLVGKLFLDNPNKYPYVCHKDDNKENPDVSNLYWGDASINGKDAFAHGLVANDKGYEDSQSIPVSVFDINGNHICNYGSISIAAQKTGFTKRGVIFQCKHLMRSKPRKGIIFRFQDEFEKEGFVL